jgi:uncharacterized protein (DUF4415 family)
MTPGVTGETVEGMSLEHIPRLIALIRRAASVWTPVRRIYIPKQTGGSRPLGIPDGSEKRGEEVLRRMLEADFLEAHCEPRFSARSHGFRPHRGCHTAVQEVKTWTGTQWVLEGDINGCCAGVDHEVRWSILAETIHANRFLRRIRHRLQAGSRDGGEYGAPLSGTPQGGVLSPLLANVYLDQRDQVVATELHPADTRGPVREDHRDDRRISDRLGRARQSGATPAARRLARALGRLPRGRPDDPAFRRRRYVRSADDCLLGFIGPVEEAKEIKQRRGVFLRDHLKRDRSQEQTLSTHARPQAARFLNEAIRVQDRDDLLPHQGRKTNGKVALRIPADVVEAYRASYRGDRHPKRNLLLAQESACTIVDRSASIFRGRYSSSAWAQHVSWLLRLKVVLQRSLLHTRAAKHRTSSQPIRKRSKTQLEPPSGRRTWLDVRIEREHQAPLMARLGGCPVIRHEGPLVRDRIPYQGPRMDRTERIQRVLHEDCELCGNVGPVEGHHIRKLADLQRHGTHPPAGVQVMAMRRRKALFVCRACHAASTYGRLTMVRSPS